MMDETKKTISDDNRDVLCSGVKNKWSRPLGCAFALLVLVASFLCQPGIDAAEQGGNAADENGATKGGGASSPEPEAGHQHVEQISNGEKTYRVNVGGTLDSFNTAYYPETYSNCMRKESKFQPNRYVTIENTGQKPVVNPRIVVNGRRDWFSADTILASILDEGMSEREKAIAIWSFTADITVQAHDNNRRVGPAASDYLDKEKKYMESWPPSRSTFQERANPVKAANFYYCSGCSLSAANYVILARAAGIPARAVWMCPLDTYATHCVAEAWYEGDWHLFDPERRHYFLEMDNVTVASYRDVHEKPELAKRTHAGGFASKGKKSHAVNYEKFFPPHEMPVEKWLSTMGMTLRPGEKFIWRWEHDGKFRWGDNHRNDGIPPYRLANGKMIYRPRFDQPCFGRDIVAGLNVESLEAEDGKPLIRPIAAGKRSYVIYKIETPYPIVGGLVGAAFHRESAGDSCSIYLSVANSDWTAVWSAGQEKGTFEHYVHVDDVIEPGPTPARYEYYVKYEFEAANNPAHMVLRDAYIETDVQMASSSLPALSVGENVVQYTDDTRGSRSIKVVHGWDESSETRPPQPPAAPVAPRQGVSVRLAALERLEWKAATDPEGGGITDYHVQVSPRSDMLYPVSPNFDRITFSDSSSWETPKGFMLEGETYYWRVRARDGWGAWSDWSEVWSFEVE